MEFSGVLTSYSPVSLAVDKPINLIVKGSLQAPWWESTNTWWYSIDAFASNGSYDAYESGLVWFKQNTDFSVTFALGKMAYSDVTVNIQVTCYKGGCDFFETVIDENIIVAASESPVSGSNNLVPIAFALGGLFLIIGIAKH